MTPFGRRLGPGVVKARGPLHAGDLQLQLLGKLLMAENLPRHFVVAEFYLAGHGNGGPRHALQPLYRLGGRMTMLAQAVKPPSGRRDVRALKNLCGAGRQCFKLWLVDPGLAVIR